MIAKICKFDCSVVRQTVKCLFKICKQTFIHSFIGFEYKMHHNHKIYSTTIFFCHVVSSIVASAHNLTKIYVATITISSYFEKKKIPFWVYHHFGCMCGYVIRHPSLIMVLCWRLNWNSISDKKKIAQLVRIESIILYWRNHISLIEIHFEEEKKKFVCIFCGFTYQSWALWVCWHIHDGT